MALKDWKKVSKDEWVNKKNSNKLLIYDGQINDEGDSGWITEVETKFGGQSGLPSKGFKAKSQAESFAKNYMRNN